MNLKPSTKCKYLFQVGFNPEIKQRLHKQMFQYFSKYNIVVIQRINKIVNQMSRDPLFRADAGFLFDSNKLTAEPEFTKNTHVQYLKPIRSTSLV